ncbi:MAG: hypothetical protein FWF28_07830 [Micrococcales bacterium]|nr:hypothetical protein [Micrococcales bacterium]
MAERLLTEYSDLISDQGRQIASENLAAGEQWFVVWQMLELGMEAKRLSPADAARGLELANVGCIFGRRTSPWLAEQLTAYQRRLVAA